MKRLSSRANPHFKTLKALAEGGRAPRKLGLALIEGSHLVAAFGDKVGRPEQVVVSESGLAQPEIAALAKGTGSEAWVLADSLFREISNLATPTGILAIVRIPAGQPPRRRGSVVLLDAVQDAGNVGSILRTAAAAGIADVFLGPGCAGAWTPRVLRAAQGAHFDLAIHEQADLARAIGEFAGPTLAAVAAGGRPLYACDLGEPVAWLFGNEGAGISAALLPLVAASVAIPMAPGSESLNVAAAAAICLFEEVRQKRQPRSAGPEAGPPGLAARRRGGRA